MLHIQFRTRMGAQNFVDHLTRQHFGLPSMEIHPQIMLIKSDNIES